MNEKVKLPYSGERLSFFKLFSEKKFRVEIPIIQRDYAQGRISQKEVRENFLGALYTYLEQGKPNRDLDFIYGSLLDGENSFRFVPLDGQQRLTTLFLLHWYLAQISTQMDVLREVLFKNNKSLFSYETRASSSEFCTALMAHDINMTTLISAGLGKTSRLSETIQDKGWFYSSWTHDPTIQSMLTMLDSIQAKFSDKPEFFQKLIDEERPVITFLFLNLREFDLSDDLYIKMNARGKPLTGFENFKAKFEQQIKSFKDELPTYTLNFGDQSKSVNGYDYFIHKIDTDWADIFWAYRDTGKTDDTFDDELMSFIGHVIANYILLDGSTSSGTQENNINKFLGASGRVSRLSFQEYNDLNCFSKGLVEHLIQMMDLLHHNGLKDGKLNAYLKNSDYYSEDEVFRKVIGNRTSYPEKLRFYAFYIHMVNGRTESNLLEWLRVIYNLTENTIINTARDYKRALISICELSNKSVSILDALRSGCDVAMFTGAQVLEEKIKAHLIGKSKEWEELVVNTEHHTFFKGQIGFILSFSGILEFYRDNDCCEWDRGQNIAYLDAFRKYANASSQLFSLIGKDSAKIDYLWERAVLSKGVYFTEAGAYKRNLLSTRLGKNNIERDHSWRRLLQMPVDSDSKWAKWQDYVKAVFDDPQFDLDHIKHSLNLICGMALKDNAIEGWRKSFIKHPGLFEECHQGFIVQIENDVFLLNESQRNHYHSELRTRVLAMELTPEQAEPFKLQGYQQVKSQQESPYANLTGRLYDQEEYAIEIRYFSNKYEMRFHAPESQKYPDDVLTVLGANNLELSDQYQDSSYLYRCKTSKETIKYIENLCSSLNTLAEQ